MGEAGACWDGGTEMRRWLLRNDYYIGMNVVMLLVLSGVTGALGVLCQAQLEKVLALFFACAGLFLCLVMLIVLLTSKREGSR